MCNLASIAVNQFVNTSTKMYDFKRLKEVTKVVTKNVNKIINVNYYPVPEARKSNLRHRPVGIGVSCHRAILRSLVILFLDSKWLENQFFQISHLYNSYCQLQKMQVINVSKCTTSHRTLIKS